MKKVLSLAAAGLMIAGLSSCKKEYTCECTATVFGITSSASTTIKDTKKNAEEACDAGDSAVTSCEIK